MLKRLAALAALFSLVPSPSIAGSKPLKLVGDSIAYGYCLRAQDDQFGFLIAKEMKTTASDSGADGYTVGTVQQREVGTPGAPVLARNAYGTVVDISGTNDMIIYNEHPTTWHTMAQLVAMKETLESNIRALEPQAKIIVEGVRDLGYNDSRISTAGKATFASRIGEYDSAVRAWVEKQPGMAYLSIFPASEYSAYYTHANTCGPWHPSEAAQGMFESYAYGLLDAIAAERYVRPSIRVIRF
jgi:hypothetical protein